MSLLYLGLFFSTPSPFFFFKKKNRSTYNVKKRKKKKFLLVVPVCGFFFFERLTVAGRSAAKSSTHYCEPFVAIGNILDLLR